MCQRCNNMYLKFSEETDETEEIEETEDMPETYEEE
jgi:hypothetical protein